MAAPAHISDLWEAKADAERMYQLYLVRLQMNGLHDRAVGACRPIRRYAARGPGRRAALFTFSFEVDALVKQRNYLAAWRQVQLRDQIIRGRRIALNRRKWSPKDFSQLYYPPLIWGGSLWAITFPAASWLLAVHFGRMRAH